MKHALILLLISMSAAASADVACKGTAFSVSNGLISSISLKHSSSGDGYNTYKAKDENLGVTYFASVNDDGFMTAQILDESTKQAAYSEGKNASNVTLSLARDKQVVLFETRCE